MTVRLVNGKVVSDYSAQQNAALALRPGDLEPQLTLGPDTRGAWQKFKDAVSNWYLGGNTPELGSPSTALQKLFSIMDTQVAAENAALMAPPGKRLAAARTAADVARRGAGAISFQDVAAGLGNLPATPEHQARPNPAHPIWYAISQNPVLSGLGGYSEEVFNLANYAGGLLGGAKGVVGPALQRVIDEAGISHAIDPLAGTTPRARSIATRLAQNEAQSKGEATLRSFRMFADVAPADEEMVSHLVEAQKPNATMEDQFRWANAMQTRPDLIRVARDINKRMYETGLAKELPKPKAGYMKHMGQVDRPETVQVTDAAGQTITLPTRKQRFATTGSRRFTIDPGSRKPQKLVSISEGQRNPARLMEARAPILVEHAERSAERYKNLKQFGQGLQAAGELSNVPYYLPVSKKTLPNLAALQTFAKQRGAQQANLGRFKGIATPYQLGRISAIKTASRQFKGGPASVASAQTRQLMAARLLAIRQAKDNARHILESAEPVIQKGNLAFGTSQALPEALRGKQARDVLVRFANQTVNGDLRQAPEQIEKFLKILDTWNGLYRVGLIANVAYHPLFNELPQFESVVGSHFGMSGPAVLLRNAGSITRFFKMSAKGPASILEAANPELKRKLLQAKDLGGLAAIAPSLTVKQLRASRAARAWDWNNRIVFGIDDVFSAEAIDNLIKKGMDRYVAAKTVRDAMGRYGPAYHMPILNPTTINRLMYFFPWMQTIIGHWFPGGKGWENLKPMMELHGYQANYNQQQGVDTPNPMVIGHTNIMMPWRTALNAINNPMSLPGWALGHVTPPGQMLAATVLNSRAPFAASAYNQFREVKPWAQIRTPGMTMPYQVSELLRFYAEAGIPFGGTVARAIQGFQDQGIGGAIEGAAGGALPMRGGSKMNYTVAASMIHDARVELAAHHITPQQYLMMLEMADKFEKGQFSK